MSVEVEVEAKKNKVSVVGIEKLPTTLNLGVEKSLVDNHLKPFFFDEKTKRIILSDKYTNENLSNMFSQIQVANDVVGKVSIDEPKNIVNFLAKNGGKIVKDLFGYSPHNYNGSPGYVTEKNLLNGGFVFGRIYTPDIKGFNSTIFIKNEKYEGSHFKITVPYFSSEIVGGIEVKIDQELDVSKSVDLVLPATYKIIRWQNKKENYFYTTELYSNAQLITTRRASNPYIDSEGFEKLKNKEGLVNLISSNDYKKGSGPCFSIKRNEIFNVGFEFPLTDEVYFSGYSSSYKATSKQLVEIKYSIPREKNYVMFNALSGKNSRFEHYWSSKDRN